MIHSLHSGMFPRSAAALFVSPLVALCLGVGTVAAGFAQSPADRQHSSGVLPDSSRAADAYLAGARLLDREDLPGAQREFARATTLDPTHAEYGLALALTREHRVTQLLQAAAEARLGNQPARADTLLAQARTISPDSERVLEHTDAGQLSKPAPRSAPEISFLPPIELAPDGGPHDLHLRGDTRQVITQAALAYGIRVVFDPSVVAQNLRFDLEHTPYTESMPILLRMARLFAVPVDSKTLLVSKDTEENRARFEREVEETVYIPASSPELIGELTNIIKSVFDIKQIALSPGSGTFALRGTMPTLQAVNYTLADMLDGGSEVMLEIKLISVARSLTHNIGALPPTSFSAYSVAAEVASFVAANQTIINAAIASGAYTLPAGSRAAQTINEAIFLIASGLATDPKLTNVIRFFGNGITLFGTSINSGATFNFGLNHSEAHALEDINVRIGDRQQTVLRIGEKYPVTTATYSSGISSSTANALAGKSINGQSLTGLLNAVSAATVPQVQYEDLGITLKTTPNIQRSGLVRLDIDLKIEALTGTALNNIPVLTNSIYTSSITVPDGDTVLMLSNLSRTESASISGLAGLAELPGFNETVSNKLRETDSSELVMLITPHIVRRRLEHTASRIYPFTPTVPQDF